MTISYHRKYLFDIKDIYQHDTKTLQEKYKKLVIRYAWFDYN